MPAAANRAKRFPPPRALTAAAIVLAACTESAPPTAEEAEPRPVKYIEVAAQETTRTRTFAGFAKARIRSVLGFRVAGTVQRVYVEEGDVIEEGDLIAEIDPVDFEIQVREIEASLAEAKAREALADSDFQRIQRLYEKDNVSQGDFDSALAKQKSARAGVDVVERRLERARRQSEHTRLRAPFAVAVAAVKVREGGSVRAGTAVVDVLTGDNPQVEIAVSEIAIADIRKGASARVRFSALPGKTFTGRVMTLGVTPGEGVTTYPVTIELDRSWEQFAGSSGDLALRPGMAVEAEMQFGGGGAAYVVPANAAAADREGKFVYVVESSGGGSIAVRRSVETGRLVPAGLEVVSGLSAGEKVVTAGVNRIADGQRVRLLPRD